jgi:hypothetical protein
MESGDPDELISLNVGGTTQIAVQRRTLVQAEGSKLQSMFRGQWNLPKDQNGNVIIDQSPKLFVTLLDYLRCVRDELPESPRAKPPTHLGHAFETMVEHYLMTFFVYRLELRVLTLPPPSSQVFIESDHANNTYKVESPNKWITVELGRVGHERRIITYSVTLGEFSNARIGWRNTDEPFPGDDQSPQNMESPLNPAKGVGDFAGTIALDCGLDWDQLYMDGNTGADGFDCSYPLEGQKQFHFSVNKGTTIECWTTTPPSMRGTLYPGRPVWIVDGNPLDSFVLFPWEARSALPCISVKGSLLIHDVKYEGPHTAPDILQATRVVGFPQL